MTHISYDLRSIADGLGARAFQGKSLAPEQQAQLALVILNLASRAEILEMLPVALREADIVELHT
jgi:hypothetical protein